MKIRRVLPLFLWFLVGIAPMAAEAEEETVAGNQTGLEVSDALLQGVRGRALPETPLDPTVSPRIILWDEARLDPERLIRDGKQQCTLMRLQGEVMAEKR